MGLMSIPSHYKSQVISSNRFMHILQPSSTMTMVAAPAASEEMSPNGTIMAYMDCKSHSSLTFSFTSQGII